MEGPSHDHLYRVRDLSGIKARGQWRTDGSVLRYEAHARLQQIDARLEPKLREAAQAAPTIMKMRWLSYLRGVLSGSKRLPNDRGSHGEVGWAFIAYDEGDEAGRRRWDDEVLARVHQQRADGVWLCWPELRRPTPGFTGDGTKSEEDKAIERAQRALASLCQQLRALRIPWVVCRQSYRNENTEAIWQRLRKRSPGFASVGLCMYGLRARSRMDMMFSAMPIWNWDVCVGDHKICGTGLPHKRLSAGPPLPTHFCAAFDQWVVRGITQSG